MHRRGGGQTGPAHVYGNFDNRSMTESDLYYPQRIIKFPVDKDTIHPTQKPVALLEYFIRTYTNEGDTVLDFTAGSFTTGTGCGVIHDRDENAAINIERVGASTLRLGDVRPAVRAIAA